LTASRAPDSAHAARRRAAIGQLGGYARARRGVHGRSGNRAALARGDDSDECSRGVGPRIASVAGPGRDGPAFRTIATATSTITITTGSAAAAATTGSTVAATAAGSAAATATA